ncbi:hypothetical protein JHK87_001191 [Glycine soja]|nr:hypothetical protein JHK87_001191 [Glycine soja]
MPILFFYFAGPRIVFSESLGSKAGWEFHLLDMCGVYAEFHELAEFAAKFLLKLDPTIATGYVQLANVYAEHKIDDHLASIRRSMKENNVVKIPGYSWIEINSVVHEFRSSNTLHPKLAFL